MGAVVATAADEWGNGESVGAVEALDSDDKMLEEPAVEVWAECEMRGGPVEGPLGAGESSLRRFAEEGASPATGGGGVGERGRIVY